MLSGNGAASATEVTTNGFDKIHEASVRSQGSTTNSLTSTAEVTEEESPLTPSMVDCKRLSKIKAEQEQRLQMLRARVDRLQTTERKVWKDVTWTQQRSLAAQEAQWRRQAQQAERLRLERDLVSQEQALRERAREARQRASETKDVPRLRKFEENQAIGKQVRQDSKRLMAALQEVREQTLQSKAMQVEVRRQQRRQQLLRKELEGARKEQSRQDYNALKCAELQEEIQNAELAIAAAEREELSAVSRLQNSQSVRAEVLTQLQDIEACSEENGEMLPTTVGAHAMVSEPAAPVYRVVPGRSGSPNGMGNSSSSTRSPRGRGEMRAASSPPVYANGTGQHRQRMGAQPGRKIRLQPVAGCASLGQIAEEHWEEEESLERLDHSGLIESKGSDQEPDVSYG